MNHPANRLREVINRKHPRAPENKDDLLGVLETLEKIIQSKGCKMYLMENLCLHVNILTIITWNLCQKIVCVMTINSLCQELLSH